MKSTLVVQKFLCFAASPYFQIMAEADEIICMTEFLPKSEVKIEIDEEEILKEEITEQK